MTTIQALTNDQVLSATILPKLACNNRNTVRLNVAFDATWDGYAKSAVFYNSVDPTPYEVVLVNNSCIIPHEVLADAGHLYISVKGVQSDSNEVKTTTLIRYKVNPGTPSLVVSEPSPGVYDQLLQAYGNAETDISAATQNLNGKIAVERARIDNLASLPEGSTTGDAELADIRVDINGETHANAGAAVRRQVAEIHGVLNGEGITLLQSDFEVGSWAAKEGGFYYTNLRVRCALPISKGDVISVKPNGLYVTALIIPDKSSTTILDTNAKGYTNTPFEMGCAYDGYVIFLAAYDTASQVKITPEELTSEITIYRELSNNVGRGKVIYPVEYEMGNIFIDSSGFDYNGATTRVRTPEGYTVPLAKGDIIRLKDYTDTRFYVGWVNPDGTYGKKGWLTYDFVCPVNAEYVILVCNTVDTKISSAEVLGSLIEVQTSISNESISKSFAENQWQSKEISKISKANRNIRSINHRGYNTLAPENTLSAYRISKKMGFDYVECDVSFTKDGVAVLLHDGTVDRTSDGTGNIANMTFEEARALDFGSWFSDSFAGEKIPSFEEFISLCKYANLHPYIELKAGTEAQIKGLVDTVKKYGMQNGVSWISFDAKILGYVKDAYNKARVGCLVNTLDEAAITTAQGLKTGENEVFINSAHSAVTDATAELCANADIPLEVWTVNKKDVILALPSYVSGFSSDSIIANEVFYDNYAIDDKAVVIRGGDAVIYPVGLKGDKGDPGKDCVDPDDLGLEQDIDTGIVYPTYRGSRSANGIPLAASGSAAEENYPVVFEIDLTTMTATCEKNFAEIQAAVSEGKFIYGAFNYMGAPIRIPFICIFQDDQPFALFEGTYELMGAKMSLLVLADGTVELSGTPISSDDTPAARVDLSRLETDGVVEETFADGTVKTTTISFDSDGNPIKITDGDGNVTELIW